VNRLEPVLGWGGSDLVMSQSRPVPRSGGQGTWLDTDATALRTGAGTAGGRWEGDWLCGVRASSTPYQRRSFILSPNGESRAGHAWQGSSVWPQKQADKWNTKLSIDRYVGTKHVLDARATTVSQSPCPWRHE
jgi:hypothetical protein